jgi:cytochrome c oxidase subunit II
MKGRMGRFRILFLLGTLALLLAGCGNPYVSALQPKGEGAEISYNMMLLSIGIMVLVIVVVVSIYIFVVVRFRQKKGREDYIPKQVEGNHMLETIWTIIPIILLLILAVPTVKYTFALSDVPDAEESVEEDVIWIDVTAKQFWWNFNYRDLGINTSQELYIPTDKRVYLKLSSGDVIHSFWVPTLSGKLDTNPGKNENEMFLHAYDEGVYWGHCAEFCGPSHSLMDFQVIAVSPGEFDQWVQDMQNINADEVPADTVAAEGQELFQQSCVACHAVNSSPSMGPNLANFGDRTKVAGILDFTKEDIVNWIMDPEKYKPGNEMTGNYNVPSKEDAGKIAEYLMSLKPSEIGPDDAKDKDYLHSEKAESDDEETESAE